MNDYERLQDELLNIRNSAQVARDLAARLLDHEDVLVLSDMELLSDSLLSKLRRKAREQSLAAQDSRS
jgi:hypothetical protein